MLVVNFPIQRVNRGDGMREAGSELRDWSRREGESMTVSSCLSDPPDFPLSMNQCRLSLSHYSYKADR